MDHATPHKKFGFYELCLAFEKQYYSAQDKTVHFITVHLILDKSVNINII